MKITRNNTTWGRRIAAAKKRGHFLEVEDAESGNFETCLVGELFSGNIITKDERLYDLGLKICTYIESSEQISEGVFRRLDELYDQILKIRNEEYE